MHIYGIILALFAHIKSDSINYNSKIINRSIYAGAVAAGATTSAGAIAAANAAMVANSVAVAAAAGGEALTVATVGEIAALTAVTAGMGAAAVVASKTSDGLDAVPKSKGARATNKGTCRLANF